MSTSISTPAVALACAGVGIASFWLHWHWKRARPVEENADLNPRQIEDLDDFDVYTQISQDGYVARAYKSSVKRIRISGKGPGLTVLSPTVFTLTQLVEIDLSGNSIVSIPFSIDQLQHLKILNLSNNNLTSLPQEMAALVSLVDLNVSHNDVQALHPALGDLTAVKYLNLMCNRLAKLPDTFGNLSALTRLGLKNNKLAQLPASFTKLSNLQELYLTSNELREFPDGFGNLSSLVKLQASFNRFVALPADLSQLQHLELMRVAMCNIAEVPQEWSVAGGPPALAWFSLAGNPAAPSPPPIAEDFPRTTLQQVPLQKLLGSGASGDVHLGVHEGRKVAVKLFRAELSPDGHTREEMALSTPLQHAHLTRVSAVVDEPPALIMELVSGATLAARPAPGTLLRSSWPADACYEAAAALRLAGGLADALAYLHSRHVCHGDLYAHNVMADSKHHATLCDFGAAFAYAEGQNFWESLDVRAFGIFLSELQQRSPQLAAAAASATAKALAQLVAGCLSPDTTARPKFSGISTQLQEIAGFVTHDE